MGPLVAFFGMKLALLTAIALSVAAPAMAQPVTFGQPPRAQPPEQILAAAPPGMRALFTAGPEGLRHLASGFRCPGVAGSAALTGIGGSADAVWCQYTDRYSPVLRLEFLREAGPNLLSETYCRGLPKALHIGVGLVFAGASRLEGPAQPPRFGTALVRGRPVYILECDWVRAPFDTSHIAIQAAAARPPGAWSVRSTQTPVEPRTTGRFTPVYSVYDLLRPHLVIGEAIADPGTF
jgi:hypothetical protein